MCALPEKRIRRMKNREIGYALMRITYGVIFLFYGIGKFMGGLSNFVGGMNQRFSGKLPAIMVMPFAYVLPFGEVLLWLVDLNRYSMDALFSRRAPAGFTPMK